jgi:hypothetical protein
MWYYVGDLYLVIKFNYEFKNMKFCNEFINVYFMHEMKSISL